MKKNDEVKKNKQSKLIYVYVTIISGLCLLYWGLEIYQINIGDAIISNQDKYINLYEKSKVIHSTQSFIEILILIISLILILFYIIKANNYSKQNIKKFIIANVYIIIFIYLVSFILLNILNMNYSDFTFSLIIIYIFPSVVIALIYLLLKLIIKHKKNTDTM